MRTPETETPINPLPPVVMALFLVMVGIEAVFGLATRGLIGGPAAVGWRLEAVEQFAFIPDILDWMLANNHYPAQHMIRFVSYSFLHGNFTHALFAGVILLAMGKFVGDVMGQFSILLVFVLSALVGALAYWGLTDARAALIGGYPAVYGLIGAFTYMQWVSIGRVGGSRARAFQLIGFLVGLQLVFGALFGNGNMEWVADLAGFATGFALSTMLINGGWAGLLRRIRKR